MPKTKRAKRTQITIYFPDPNDASFHKQISSDAEKSGISISTLAKMALEIGYPEVRRTIDHIKPLGKSKAVQNRFKPKDPDVPVVGLGAMGSPCAVEIACRSIPYSNIFCH